MAEKPISLGLIVRVPAAMRDNPALTGASIPPTLTVQMDSQSGQIYLIPLSVQAGIGLMKALATWPPVQDYLSGPEPNEPPKIQ